MTERIEIIQGIKQAIERGSSLELAKSSFINAGYSQQDVEDSCNSITGSITRMPSFPPQQFQSQFSDHLSSESKFPYPSKSEDKTPALKLTNQYQSQPTQNTQNSQEPKKGVFMIVVVVILAIILLALLGVLALVIFSPETLTDILTSLHLMSG